MRSRAGILGALGAAMAVASLALAISAPVASAAFGVSKWEAGTCTIPTCEYSSPESTFYTQVAGRPNYGITDFTFNTTGGIPDLPEGSVQDVRVDLPTGLSVNPQATAQCTEAELKGAGCPVTSKVGTVKVTPFKVGILGELLGGLEPAVPAPVYNIVPKPGIPAEFGFRVNLLGLVDLSIFLEGTVNWENDYHEGFTIRAIPDTVPLARNRLEFEGRAGSGSFITIGSNCAGSTTTGLTVDSHQAPGAFLHYDTTPIGTKIIQPTGCAKVPFDPTVAVDAGTQQVDSPGGAAVAVGVPFNSSAEIGQSYVKRAAVTLPLGSGLNPSAAPPLKFCADKDLNKGIAIGSRLTDPGGVHPPPVACPAASQIGTVAINTPVLPNGSINGAVYLGQQLSRDPSSGKEYRLFVNAESPRYGIYVRLIGEVVANPKTGQLTAVFDEPAQGGLPQVPFSSFRLQLNGGEKAPLTSPPICGPNTTSTRLVPWSGNAPSGPTTSTPLTKAPGGGPCPKAMAERPFAPGFDAAPKSTDALTYTPFTARLTRPQGQQELKGVDIHLPPGATAKLAGVPYCPPSDIAAAAGRAGAAEKKNSSCPNDSQVGVANIQAGTGNTPLQIDGEAFLAGPYKGAPLSLAVITPAVAGPFDLGTVVVRVPLKVDPETAQINPDTEIPDVFGGAKLDIRSIFVNVNRKEFTLNGTNCAKHATTGNLLGGGADPTNPASFFAAKVSAPVELNGCKGLKFRPKLKLRLFGATHRNQHPRLRAALKARAGDANIARASVGLPHAIFLDQASLGTVCTRPQFAANQCPKRSIYGRARAFTPLLGKPLEGPVVLRSNPSHTLPDMVAHLEGQVDIDLVGVIDSFKGGIRTTFNTVPDVPVSKFVLTLPGGKHGLLVASTNLCKNPPRAIVRFKGQNGKKVNRKQKLRTPCGKKSKKGSKKKHGKG